MRNIIGFLAQRKLNTAIAAALKIAGVTSFFLGAGGKNWSNTADADQDEIALAKGLSWTVGAGKRTLLYNIKVPQIGSNVDLCLFNCECKSYGEKILALNDSFVALGELKGGIDPAGADEHWKTARSALMRIRNNFSSQKRNPLLFFIGAAIEQRMGSEIWSELQSGQLNNAANLTKPIQVASLCNWLITI